MGAVALACERAIEPETDVFLTLLGWRILITVGEQPFSALSDVMLTFGRTSVSIRGVGDFGVRVGL